MTTSAKTGFAQTLDGFKAGLRHAFAVASAPQPFSAEDDALLSKVAAVIVRRRMTEPAILFLESTAPLNFLSSQALHFLAPILDLACDAREIERAAAVLERRDAVPRLIALIEAAAAPEGTSAR